MLSILIRIAVATGLIKPTTDMILGTITKGIDGLTKVSEKHQKAHDKAEQANVKVLVDTAEKISRAKKAQEAAVERNKAKASKAREEFTKAERVKQKLSDLIS